MRSATPNIVISLVGNKLDLASQRQVTFEEGQAYAEEANLLFTESSARTGEAVSDAFIKIAKKLPKTEEQKASPRLNPDARRVDLSRGGANREGAYSTSNRCC